MKQKRTLGDRAAHFIVAHGGFITRIFIIVTIICACCYPLVGVNYDLSTYLPSYAQTKQALDIMKDEFGYPGMARVMVKDCTLSELRQIREKIADLPGVSMVVGSDMTTNIYSGDVFDTNELTDEFYKDGCGVMEIIFE